MPIRMVFMTTDKNGINIRAFLEPFVIHYNFPNSLEGRMKALLICNKRNNSKEVDGFVNKHKSHLERKGIDSSSVVVREQPFPATLLEEEKNGKSIQSI